METQYEIYKGRAVRKLYRYRFRKVVWYEQFIEYEELYRIESESDNQRYEVGDEVELPNNNGRAEVLGVKQGSDGSIVYILDFVTKMVCDMRTEDTLSKARNAAVLRKDKNREEDMEWYEYWE